MSGAGATGDGGATRDADGTSDAGPTHDAGPTRVAIACQGGGSHTAFTAGVLQGLLPAAGPSVEVVGLSGASGGAMCALVAWYGLLVDGEARAAELLEAFWEDLMATSPVEGWVNELVVRTSSLLAGGVPLPQVSPYHAPASGIGRRRLEGALRRHVDFDRLPDLAGDGAPSLLVSTVDVNSGSFKTVRNGQVTPAAMLASAAVPTLFEAVRLDRTDPRLDPAVYDGHYHWDGLFAQNPPVRDFLDVADVAADKPNEIWIVQVNPETRTGEPRSLEAITDRRNELSGNLSLEQEVDFIEQVNEWLAADPPKLRGEYKPVAVERIRLAEELSPASKLDRSEPFVRGLMADGRDAAAAFLERRSARVEEGAAPEIG